MKKLGIVMFRISFPKHPWMECFWTLTYIQNSYMRGGLQCKADRRQPTGKTAHEVNVIFDNLSLELFDIQDG